MTTEKLREKFKEQYNVNYRDIGAMFDEFIAPLVDALEFECGKRCAIGINPCNAREAIEEFEKKLGEL